MRMLKVSCVIHNVFVWWVVVHIASKLHWIPGPPHEKGRSDLLSVVVITKLVLE